MKRTYVNRLPKNEEVKNTNVRVENGEVIVEVEFKDKFEPKDGDFLVDKKSGTITIIYKCKDEDGAIISYAGLGSCIATTETRAGWGYIKDFRLTTPEEKSEFLERLEKNAESNEEIYIKFIDETDYDIDNIIELNKKFYENN